jgi:hypothetical protein
LAYEIANKIEMPTAQEITESLQCNKLKSCSEHNRPTSVFDKNYLFSPYDKDKDVPKPSFECKHELVYKITVYSQIRHLKEQEFVILGSKTLEDLEKEIECLNDQQTLAMNELPSYFIINSIIFARNSDFKPIKDSLNELGKSQAKFDLLEEAQLRTIDFKIGEVYLYRHHNTCDHYFNISEIRLFDP